MQMCIYIYIICVCLCIYVCVCLEAMVIVGHDESKNVAANMGGWRWANGRKMATTVGNKREERWMWRVK